MAGIIKNQILKHLSRYAKNLSSDRINLSTFKGEGELHNLELDEVVMTELLSLPTWMKLTHAHCNHVLIRIPWTKLKSVPIHLSLDEVSIRVEACEELRTGGAGGTDAQAPSFGKYGFVNKVIDGITATVNSVQVTFHSQDFEAKVQISRIRVESKSPEWQKSELSGTRLKDMNKGEVLIFKEMDWQTLRLEARSTSDRHLAPLRLLTNQAKARIVIKKKLIDSLVTGCRLSLILDDLLWVLTDSQILAALHFVNSLSGLVKQATELTQRVKAVRKLESLPEYQAQQIQTSALDKNVKPIIGHGLSIKKFDIHDVRETSYHFVCEKIDLHFCDDPGSGRSQHPDLKDGGALQVSLAQVMLDFYPYHLARGSRKFWPKYSDNTLSHWLHQSLQSFKIGLIDTLSSGSLHTPLSRVQNLNQPSSNYHPESTNPVKESVTTQLMKLMSTCLILKIQDLRLYRVTTSSKRESPMPFVSAYIDRPKDLPLIHTEFSWFYYPGEMCFPLPSQKIYTYMHPVQINLDICTVLWLNSFISNLGHTMTLAKTVPEQPDYVDIRVEMIMPKIVFETDSTHPGHKERPNSIHIQASRLLLSNFRSAETGTLHQLTQCIELLQRGDLVYGTDFPTHCQDTPLLVEKFVKHAEGQDKLRIPKKLNCSSFTEVAADLTHDMLWIEPRDIWYISLDPIWAEFHIEPQKKRYMSGSGSNKRKSSSTTQEQNETKAGATVIYPFIDAISLSAWIYVNELPKPNSKLKKKNIHGIFGTTGTCKIQLTHYQFLFLMRMIEAIGEMSLYLTLDLETLIGKNEIEDMVTFLGCLGAIDLSLLFESQVANQSQKLLQLDSPSIGEMDSNNQDSITSPGGGGYPDNDAFEDNNKEMETTRSSLFIPSASLSSSPVPMSLPSSNLIKNHVGGSNPVLGVGIGSNTSDGLKGLNQNVKHSLTNLAVSFNKGISTPDSEVASNWSNFSSDSSDNFVQLDVTDPETASSGGGIVSIFQNATLDPDDEDLDDGVEVATEVVEENDLTQDRLTPSPMPNHPTSIRAINDNIVKVVALRLEGLEIAQESKGLSSIIKLQTKSLGLTECGDMGWNEFQMPVITDQKEEKFNGRSIGAPTEPSGNLGSPTQRRAIKLRLVQTINGCEFMKCMGSDEMLSKIKDLKSPHNPRVNLSDRPGTESPLRQLIIDCTKPFLDAKVDLRNEEELRVHMSTMEGIADFFEDEILPSPFDMEIELTGLMVELIEDRPPKNITSPGPVPIKISISSPLPISRDSKGVFHIGNGNHSTKAPTKTNLKSLLLNSGESEKGDTSRTSNFGATEIDSLQKELERTLRQLSLAQEKNAALEKELESNELLKVMVMDLQEQVSRLQNERSNHLSQLKKYQPNQNHY